MSVVLRGRRQYCLCGGRGGDMVKCSAAVSGCNGWVHTHCCGRLSFESDGTGRQLYCPMCVAAFLASPPPLLPAPPLPVLPMADGGQCSDLCSSALDKGPSNKTLSEVAGDESSGAARADGTGTGIAITRDSDTGALGKVGGSGEVDDGDGNSGGGGGDKGDDDGSDSDDGFPVEEKEDRGWGAIMTGPCPTQHLIVRGFGQFKWT